MRKEIIGAAIAAAALTTACTMQNPLLKESPLDYGAPQFDKIKTEHFLPAFEAAVKESKAEIDALVANPEEPTFENVIEAMEFSGRTLGRVAGVFYNFLSCNSSPELQEVAQKVSPMMTELSMYSLFNEGLFKKIKTLYDKRDELGLDPAQYKLLTDTYQGFAKNGANLQGEDKEKFAKISEDLSLATLKFGDNVLNATNAFCMNLTDEADLAGLPESLITLAKATAEKKGQEGWSFGLNAPSYVPFMRFSDRRDLREKMYMAYNTRAVGGDFDNTELVKTITGLRLEEANMLGYETYADYALVDRMLKTPAKVNGFLKQLLDPSLPIAKKEIDIIYKFAKANGFEDTQLRYWDFSYWAEKYRIANFSLSEEEVKPYLQLGNCLDAAFGLANTLYGLKFEERTDLPVYDPDVKVFDIKDETGRHMALFYADFYSRESKRGGAWMNTYKEQWIDKDGESRPIVTLVTNFSKPVGDQPSLITHDELTTLLHEFGHCLHGILSEGRYPSQTTTNVSRDFVELPSQIMENWAFEPEFLQGFAKHCETGEVMPAELIKKIVDTQNFLSAYYQVRQLHFGMLDMAWHGITAVPEKSTLEFEKEALKPALVIPYPEGTSISTSITHLFSGGYAAGYYSYKWSEVLEADAFALFKEKGIFNREVSESFRKEILSRGSSDDESQLFRNFRGRDPKPEALLIKLDIIKKK